MIVNSILVHGSFLVESGSAITTTTITTTTTTTTSTITTVSTITKKQNNNQLLQQQQLLLLLQLQLIPFPLQVLIDTPDGVQELEIMESKDHHGTFRKAVPVLPMPLAIVCLILSFMPGLGTCVIMMILMMIIMIMIIIVMIIILIVIIVIIMIMS